nr:sigma 54-interacting transcriptional regulator [uncultured Holophaga sp.]
MEDQLGIFFREVTLRVCSSLDIRTAMGRTFPYLAEILPLEEMYLDVLDPALGAIRRIAKVSASGVSPGESIFPLPAPVWDWLQVQRESVVVGTDRSPLPEDLNRLMQNYDFSETIVPLRIEDQIFGLLILRARGRGLYSQAQARILASVADPFAIALANALAHEQLIKHKDELLDDRHFLSQEMTSITTEEIVGGTGGLLHVVEMIHQVAPRNNTALILGETGVGKEVIASAIHQASPRRNGPFIKVNCGAIPDTLIDSELFGHEKGAFTGAVSSSRGRFERAQGGTLFLDEIGELSLQAQVRLLRAIQHREIERVGGTRTIPVDVRVIAATHRNLEQMVKEGAFREDLWYRINVFPIPVPPLRHRKEDIPGLVRHFLRVKGQELGIAVLPALAPGALIRLEDYDWPGNVRELENLVERELILNPAGPLLFSSLGSQPRTDGTRAALSGPLALDEAMARHLAAVLDLTQGRILGPGGAAELLRINGSTLRHRLRKLGIPFGRDTGGRDPR